MGHMAEEQRELNLVAVEAVLACLSSVLPLPCSSLFYVPSMLCALTKIQGLMVLNAAYGR